MPKFFLHIHEHDHFVDDPEGIDAADIDAAVVQAVSGMRGIIGHHFMNEEAVTLRAIEIRDPDGKLLRTVSLREAVEGVLPQGAI